MRTQSTLTPKAYRSAMKKRMGSRFALFSERFTGLFIGRLFYVTHHAGYEWNRQITSQTNSAWGYIKKTENGCEVRYHKAQSMFCPHLLLLYILIMAPPCFGLIQNIDNLPFPVLLILLFIILFLPIIYTGLETSTEGSIEGEKALVGLLLDPTDYFAYLNARQKK